MGWLTGMSDWQFVTTREADGRVRKTRIVADDAPLSWHGVMCLWQDDADFRRCYNQALADAPFAAFYWETPAITAITVARPFEHVCVDAPALAGVNPDAEAFAEHFDARCDAGGIVAFDNLGGDASLVVPCPLGALEHYAHLASFVRRAPEDQRQAFWRRLGRAVASSLSDRLLWVSTSGAGVHWLHARLDSRPKYYTYAAYRHAQ